MHDRVPEKTLSMAVKPTAKTRLNDFLEEKSTPLFGNQK
jgi:hypothetical protein